MIKTIDVQEYSGSHTKQNYTIYTCLLFLLSKLIPEYDSRNSASPDRESGEAQYLRSHDTVFSEISDKNFLIIIQNIINNPAQGEPHLTQLIQLAHSQHLTHLEILVFILLYEVEHDPMLGRCIAYLQKPMGGSRPTLSLLSAMMNPVQELMDVSPHPMNMIAAIANSRAVKLGLIQILNESAPLPEQAAKIPTAIALCMETGDITWPGTSTDNSYPEFELPHSILKLAESQAKALYAVPKSVLVLRGASKKELTRVAHIISNYSDCQPLFIHDEQSALPALGPICHEKNLIPVFSYFSGPGEMITLPEIIGYDGAVMVMAGLEGSFESTDGNLSGWIIPRPTQEERKQLWDIHLGESDISDQLAHDHVHSAARIVELSILAKRQRISTEKEITGIEEIRQAAWLSENSGLSTLAQPVRAIVNDEALVVRPITKHQLELLESRCHNREYLGESLGVTIKARYQMGVKALFLGPSGTGKTLATSWLANRLGIPLYRVDLAAISSKYIGETEKNLAKLLGQAEQEEVVLLFDEADSIFGKRTDIKDSNDRFANAQTNYLLQRIETYSGVVILTSNSKARFDSAFTRRVDMMIEFPLPGPEERRSIWLSHLGTSHTLTKANINQLSVQCNLTGGHIRNVVLTAAVIAKSQERSITFEDVILALSDEYRKLGKQIVPELKRVIKT